jgi:uncharacterized protein (DUF427 family)
MSTAAKPVRQSGYLSRPDYDVHFEPCPKRVRVLFGGETIADSTHVERLHETRHLPVYYFPRADVRMELLTPTEHESFCPYKGEASYWTVTAGGKTAENAVWSYEAPFPEAAEIKDYLAFYWNRMDAWFEEDEEVFVHPRDPYVRVDILESHREVEVILGGRSVATSKRARFLFETGLPMRYYLPAEDVDMALLTASGKVTACPYKGTARYWTARIGDQVFDDIVWAYPEPTPESSRIKDYLCFFNELVDEIRVGGEVQARPKTKWSRER